MLYTNNERLYKLRNLITRVTTSLNVVSIAMVKFEQTKTNGNPKNKQQIELTKCTINSPKNVETTQKITK